MPPGDSGEKRAPRAAGEEFRRRAGVPRSFAGGTRSFGGAAARIRRNARSGGIGNARFAGAAAKPPACRGFPRPYRALPFSGSRASAVFDKKVWQSQLMAAVIYAMNFATDIEWGTHRVLNEYPGADSHARIPR